MTIKFYSPYVRLLKTRQPHHEHSPILKLLKPGYIDVSRYTGILCVNGPAIIYTDINHDPKCTNDTSTWMPSFGEPQMFSHDCFSFNRLPRDEYKRIGQLEMKKDSRVFGNKVFGVYLLGKSPDYRLPNFMFFPHPDFGYKTNSSWCVHDGASLAFVTNGLDTSTHCYKVKRYNMDGVLTVQYNGNPIFCSREDQDVDFDSPWHKEGSLNAEDIHWESCGESSDLMPPAGIKDFDLEPEQLPDFRIIDPRLLSNQGSHAVMYKAKRNKYGEVIDVPIFTRPNPPGSLFPGEPGWKDPSLMIHLHKPGAENNNHMDLDETTTMEPYQKFNVELAPLDCEEIPRTSDTCNDATTTNECDLLSQALSLEEIDWIQDKLKEGSWRLPIMNIITSIYEKVCPQVTKYLAPALSRIFQYFLTQAVQADPALETKFKEPKKREWLEMIMDLERCESNAQMMKFFRKKDHAAVKLKKRLEGRLVKLERRMLSRITVAVANSDDSSTISLADDHNHTSDLSELEKTQNQLNEFTLKFPYKILIGSAERPGYNDARRVYQYREAAEIDHELDWALDAYWKIISTIFGYCNIHYSSRSAETFMRLYDSFTTDFLEYILNEWIKGDNMRVYEQIFGEFIHGSGTLWIDACHDGAYQWSGTLDLRPLRPIPLNEGDVVAPPPPATAGGATAVVVTGPTNFFVDNPAFLKSSDSDYDDYHKLELSESVESRENSSPTGSNVDNTSATGHLDDNNGHSQDSSSELQNGHDNSNAILK